MLVNNSIPAAPVATPSDLFNDPQMNMKGRMSATKFADGTIAKLPRLPIAIGSGVAQMSGQVPEFAEDTDDVLYEIGVSKEDIKSLKRKGHIA